MKILQLMSKELNLDSNYILSISANNNRYKKYEIKKKNGGTRDIYHPSKELKTLQYWIVERVFSQYPVSNKYSKAYSKGNSIKKNALVHRKSNYIVHLDIKNFFPSITGEHLDRIFNNNLKLQLDEDDRNLIKDIVLYRGNHLVIGSVASPRISNCVMYDIDIEIEKQILDGTEYKYTRYADDIIISSSKYIDNKVIDKIEKILEAYNFYLNSEKTYFMNRSCKRVVTGVVIDNEKNTLGLGSKRYREIKRLIYNYLIKNKGEEDIIKGYLALINDLDSEKYLKIKEIYSKYDRENKIFE